MAVITLQFDPYVDDYDDMVAVLNAAYDGAGGDEVAPLPHGWNERRMRAYLRELSHTGHQVLRYMAENAPHCSVSDVMTHMAIADDAKFRGTMSTFGHAMRNARGVSVLPFDRQGGVYHVDPALAELIIALLDEDT